jgi:hypothetical protein
MLACLDWLDFPLPQPRSIAPSAGRGPNASIERVEANTSPRAST